jgi:hypothetical protein
MRKKTEIYAFKTNKQKVTIVKCWLQLTGNLLTTYLGPVSPTTIPIVSSSQCYKTFFFDSRRQLSQTIGSWQALSA